LESRFGAAFILFQFKPIKMVFYKRENNMGKNVQYSNQLQTSTDKNFCKTAG
jgi:hypothetical protein